MSDADFILSCHGKWTVWRGLLRLWLSPYLCMWVFFALLTGSVSFGSARGMVAK